MNGTGWTFILGVDLQEHNNDSQRYLAKLNAEIQSHGVGMVAERIILPAGDYMVFARSNRADGGTEERVLNLCIERKAMSDVNRSVLMATLLLLTGRADTAPFVTKTWSFFSVKFVLGIDSTRLMLLRSLIR